MIFTSNKLDSVFVQDDVAVRYTELLPVDADMRPFAGTLLLYGRSPRIDVDPPTGRAARHYFLVRIL